MNTLYDVIAIGDTTEDVFLGMSDANAQVTCDKDNENCKICVNYADKVAVDTKVSVPAVGNAANHAIGIARLGLRSAIYTVLGDDIQGHLAHDVFRDEKVATKYIALDHKRGTNFSVVINLNSERTILVYHEPRDYKLPQMEPTQWIYLTSSSGGGVAKLHEQVLAYLANNPSVKLAFNPGTHQLHLGLDALKPLIARTDMLFLNREEAQHLLGVTTNEPAKLVKYFHHFGVKNFILTDGPDGAYGSDGSKIWFLKIFEGPVVERTGSGDAYGTGVTAAIIKGKALDEAMLWGNANATSVVQYIGAREGLLDERGIFRLIHENPQIRPQEFTTLEKAQI